MMIETGITENELSAAQKEIVVWDTDTSARLSGPVGSGKSLILLHRAIRLLRASPDARVALTCLLPEMARRLECGFARLAGREPGLASRMTIGTWQEVATELYGYVGGRTPVMASNSFIRDHFLSAILDGQLPFQLEQVWAEWDQVVDCWQLASLTDYLRAPHPQGLPALEPERRQLLWPCLEQLLKTLEARMEMTNGELFARLSTYYQDVPDKPFDHVLVDDAQDLSVKEMMFFAAIAPHGANGLLLAGEESVRTRMPWIELDEAGISLEAESRRIEGHIRMLPAVRDFCDALISGNAVTLNKEHARDMRTVSGEAVLASLVSFIVSRDGVSNSKSAVICLNPAGCQMAQQAFELAGVEPSAYPSPKHVMLAGCDEIKGLEFDAVAVTGFSHALLEARPRGFAEMPLDHMRKLANLACSRSIGPVLVCIT